MNEIDWLPAIVTSSAVTVATLIGGYFLKAAVEKGVQHGFDREIEKLRSSLRSNEELLKGQLKNTADRLSDLRTGPLSSLAARQSTLYQRRLKAAEVVWDSVIKHGRYRMAVHLLGSLKTDALLEKSSQQNEEAKKIQQFGELMWTSNGLDKSLADPLPSVASERLFISPDAWEVFSALLYIYHHAIAIFGAIRAGVGKEAIADQSKSLSSLKKVLPFYSEFIDKFGSTGFPHLLEPLEEKLLTMFIQALDNAEIDNQAIESASKILTEIDRISSKPTLPVDLPEIYVTKPAEEIILKAEAEIHAAQAISSEEAGLKN